MTRKPSKTSSTATSKTSRSSWTSLIWKSGRRNTEYPKTRRYSSALVATATWSEPWNQEAGSRIRTWTRLASIWSGHWGRKISTLTTSSPTKSWITTPRPPRSRLKWAWPTVSRTSSGSTPSTSTPSTRVATIWVYRKKSTTSRKSSSRWKLRASSRFTSAKWESPTKQMLPLELLMRNSSRLRSLAESSTWRWRYASRSAGLWMILSTTSMASTTLWAMRTGLFSGQTRWMSKISQRRSTQTGWGSKRLNNQRTLKIRRKRKRRS